MAVKNKHLLRYLEEKIAQDIKDSQSILLLGPRQTGKTTLIEDSIYNVENKVEYYFQDPSIRLGMEADPGSIIRQIEIKPKAPLVFVDEAQKVPAVFDAAQLLIDQKKAIFILTGSSARKLRRKGVNLLPGRVFNYRLDPLSIGELGLISQSNLKELTFDNLNQNPDYSFLQSLVWGSLPGILWANNRENYLKSYTETYLEEEIRAETLLRKIGAFSRFLELAANESGTSPNFNKLSNESGVSAPAIKDFYQVLEDTLIVERIEPYLKNPRKRILSSPRYYFFDLGVRNSLARLPLTIDLINAQKGVLFEHAVVLEIIRRIRAAGKNYKVNYWRTKDGAEVDCIIDLGNEVIPIEIKCSKTITKSDLRGLNSFISDYGDLVKQAYLITLDGKHEKLTNNIIQLPWHMM